MVVLFSTTNGTCHACHSVLSLPIHTALLLMYPTGCPLKFMACSEAYVCKHIFDNAHPITSRQNSYRLVECSLCRLHSRFNEDRLSSYSSSVGTALPVLSQGGSRNLDQTNFYNKGLCEILVICICCSDLVSIILLYFLINSLFNFQKCSYSVINQSL